MNKFSVDAPCSLPTSPFVSSVCSSRLLRPHPSRQRLRADLLARSLQIGVVTAPHAESWPSSAANTSSLARQTVWIGSNSFWSANTYGADGAGAEWPAPSGGPFPHCEVGPGDEKRGEGNIALLSIHTIPSNALQGGGSMRG